MEKRLTRKAVEKRLELGDTACSIDIVTYTKQLRLVRENNIDTTRQLRVYLKTTGQNDSCALCVKYNFGCNVCPLPKVDNNLHCEEIGSVYDRYWDSDTREQLEASLVNLIDLLKRSEVIEKENMVRDKV